MARSSVRPESVWGELPARRPMLVKREEPASSSTSQPGETIDCDLLAKTVAKRMANRRGAWDAWDEDDDDE